MCDVWANRLTRKMKGHSERSNRVGRGRTISKVGFGASSRNQVAAATTPQSVLSA